MPCIHRFRSDVGATPVNAYVVQGTEGVVCVDATLTVSGGRALRAFAESFGPPLLGVVLTHAHPDHYGGLAELTRGLDVPVVSTQLVSDVVRRDDPVKEAILRPMFNDEWAAKRSFPEQVATDGETVQFGDVALTVMDLGPGESPADSIWGLADDLRRVFSADVAYNTMHAYLADGFHREWLANIARLRDALPPDATLHPGHGDPAGAEMLARQQEYVETFLAAVQGADGQDADADRAAITARMQRLLPTQDLAFLMELSIDPLLGQLKR